MTFGSECLGGARRNIDREVEKTEGRRDVLDARGVGHVNIESALLREWFGGWN